MRFFSFWLLSAATILLLSFGCQTPNTGGYTFNGGVPAQAGAAIGLNQATLVIYVRASDDSTANRAALRTSEQAEFTAVNTFLGESSFGKLSLNYTHAPTNNWYQLPDTYDDYMWTAADITAATTPADSTAAADGQNLVQDFSGFFTDALQAATDDGFNISSFEQVAVVIIGPFHRGTSYGSTNFTLTNSGGSDFQVSIPPVVVSTNTGWSRTAHEFGHAFGGFADLYGAPNRGIGNWDIMDCTDCTNQTTGFHKEVKGNWYGPGQVKTISRPAGTSQIVDNTALAPLETASPAAGDVLALKLDVGGGINLYVENRQTISGQTGSQSLPANAVIITDAIDNTSDVNASRRPILLYGGPITSGNTFTDNAYGPLTIEVTGTAPNLNVKTTWGPDPYYDLEITPWDPAPWESEDIWIDSEANGWDTYEFSDATANPNVAGNPVRNGDRPWVGRNNRVYARVTNTGTTDAANVKVNFFVNNPQGIGDAGNWIFLDRAPTIPLLAAGSNEIVSVIWRPQTEAATHTCLQARIEPQPDELNANNNRAQENVTDFNTSSASPWLQILNEVEIANPTDRHQRVRLEVVNLPSGWTAWVSERFVDLAPQETKVVSYVIDPNGGNPDGNQELKIGDVYDIHVEGWLLDVDRETRYGGITASIHTVERFESLDIISGPGMSDEEPTGDGGGIINEQPDIPSPVLGSELSKPVIVRVAPAYDTEITLEITDTRDGSHQLLRTRATPVADGSSSVAQFFLSRSMNQGEINLEPGVIYHLQAHLYGGGTVDGGKKSSVRSMQIQ